jgi:dienelactone hydrolase
MKHIFKIFVFILCLLSIHNNASAGFFGKIKSYFTRPPSTKTISFPEITGSYAVGTTSYYWKNDETNREIMVQLWYPTNVKLQLNNRTKYQGLSEDQLEGHVIYTRAITQASLSSAQKKYPIVIFSHGIGMSRFLYSAFCEELASHGYIIVGIDHPYLANIIRLPDGRMINFSIKTDDQKHEAIGNEIGDVRFVLNQLEKLNQDKGSIFFQHLDEKHIGMFGHSFGGLVTTNICQQDDRVIAGINMAGPLYEQDKVTPFNKPFMMMWGEKELEEVKKDDDIEHRKAVIDNVQNLFDALKKDKYRITIENADHNVFSDYTWLKESSIFKNDNNDLDTTPLDGYKMTRMMNYYIAWFFDKYLKNKDSKMPEYSGIKIER